MTLDFTMHARPPKNALLENDFGVLTYNNINEKVLTLKWLLGFQDLMDS